MFQKHRAGKKKKDSEISVGKGNWDLLLLSPVYGNDYCNIVSSKITHYCTNVMVYNKLGRNLLKIWKINVASIIGNETRPLAHSKIP